MEATSLQFNSSGKFRILQITDTQEIPAVSPDTIKLIEKALDQANPDLVVFTGDQIKGYGLTFKGKNFSEKVKSTISKLLEPIIKRNIPFAVTFGNHDSQAGMSAKEQWAFYKTYPLCVGEDATEADGCGTFNLPIVASSGKTIAMNVYMIDSHGDAKGGGYEPVEKTQLDWYKKTRDKLKSESGKYVPSIVFQHIPCHEYYQVLKRVKKGTKNAIRAFRTHKNEYYLLDENKTRKGDFFNEPPSISDKESGEFSAIKEKGDVFAMFVGHDHNNSFVGTHDSIDLGYTQGCGFNVYGPGVDRGVRVFEFDENSPKDYKTHTITFRELFGKKVNNPIKEFFYVHSPTTVDMAIPMIRNALLIVAGIVATIVIITNLL